MKSVGYFFLFIEQKLGRLEKFSVNYIKNKGMVDLFSENINRWVSLYYAPKSRGRT